MNRQLYLDLKHFWGALQEVANRAGVTHQSVKYVLRDGKWSSPELVAHAEAVLKERKQAMLGFLAEA